jgi:hypothetical protein
MSPSDDAAAIPSDLITTGEAIAALLATDPAVSAWQAADCPRGGGNVANVDTEPTLEPGNKLHLAAEASHERIIKAALMAIRDGTLPAIVYRDGHSAPRTELGPSFWADGCRGSLSLEHGRVRLHSELVGRPLCFTRRAWAAWCKKAKPLAVPLATEIALTWMKRQMESRRKSGQPKDRDTMVVAVMNEFPGQLDKTRAKQLFTAVPKSLKDRRGPKLGSHRKSAR